MPLLKGFINGLRSLNKIYTPLIIQIGFFDNFTKTYKIKDVLLKIRPLGLDWFIMKDIFHHNIYKAVIKPGDIVIDGGAHIGFFSLFAASKGALVYSYEPEDENFNLLLKNIRNNYQYAESINANKKAIWKNSSSVVFYKTRNHGNHSIYHYGGYVKKIKVQCVDINELLPCDLLKLDIEGAEYDVIEKADLNKVKQLCIEFHVHIKNADFHLAKMMEKIKNSGFKTETTKHSVNGYIHAWK